MCEPAEKDGSEPPSARPNSRLTMSSASFCLRMTLTESMFICLAPNSVQASDIVRQERNLIFCQFVGDIAHHLVRVVRAVAGAEVFQLRRRVAGILPGQAWKLRWQARASRTVTAGAGRQTADRIAGTI